MKRKKRTISPEHLAKMQAGRKRAQTRRKQIALLKEHDFPDIDLRTKTEKMLDSVRRK